jgi:uncharacterized lipoprotein YmbA
VLAPQPDTTRFFILSADTNIQPPSATTASSTLVVGLGPISFPDYLARTQMVTRLSDEGVAESSSLRWAEPLDVSFKRVLARDLSLTLGGAQIAVFPWAGGNPHPSFSVEMTVDRFEMDAEARAQLISRWNINASNPDRLLYSSTAAISVPAANATTDAAVAALNQALSQFAREIAAAVVDLSSRR